MIEGFRPEMKKKRTRTFGKRGQEESLAGCPGSRQACFWNEQPARDLSELGQ